MRLWTQQSIYKGLCLTIISAIVRVWLDKCSFWRFLRENGGTSDLISESLKRNASFFESVTVPLPLCAMEGTRWLYVLKWKPIERSQYFFFVMLFFFFLNFLWLNPTESKNPIGIASPGGWERNSAPLLSDERGRRERSVDIPSYLKMSHHHPE